MDKFVPSLAALIDVPEVDEQTQLLISLRPSCSNGALVAGGGYVFVIGCCNYYRSDYVLVGMFSAPGKMSMGGDRLYIIC
jgi:hypothetical protein